MAKPILLALALAAFLVTGCGVKGPLYLPGKTTAAGAGKPNPEGKK
ncbi:MAG: lipoprotein [Betaproteobacteria bacterium]|jgi:predicted small lipoprotein YifL